MEKVLARPYDLIVFGATGFTGRLAVKYLYGEYFGKENTNKGEVVKFAIVGRDAKKMRESIKYMDDDDDDDSGGGKMKPDIFVCESFADSKGLMDITAKAKVCLTFAGPFAKFGFALAEACVETKTHYCDITGEPPFIRKCVEYLDEKAKLNKTCLIN